MRVECPFDEWPESWIDVPDTFYGEDWERYLTARDSVRADGLQGPFVEFFGAMALLKDWSLPGLNGNPELWDTSKLRVEIINWVNESTLTPFHACFVIPKKKPASLSNSQPTKGTILADGT